jgi:hypothetical protein
MDEQKREQMLEYLTSERMGIPREEAELMLVDDDLWIIEPPSRYTFTGEEVVRGWSKAVDFAAMLSEGFGNPSSFTGFTRGFQGAIQQMLLDMRERAEEALRRAKERARDAA